nr:uncharacterized protein LOC113825525 [Penaeus vannamei]
MANCLLFLTVAFLVPCSVAEISNSISGQSQQDFPFLPRPEWYATVAVRLQEMVDLLASLSRNVSRLILLKETHAPSTMKSPTRTQSNPSSLKLAALPPEALADEGAKDKGASVFEAVLAVLIMLLLLAAVALGVSKGGARPRLGLV